MGLENPTSAPSGAIRPSIREIAPVTDIQTRNPLISEASLVVFESLPMQDIPLSHELDVSPDVEDVADHEFWNHAVIAYKLGVAVESLSVIPKPGVYRGVTILRSHPDEYEKMQIVAAGGIVHGRGAGSDYAHVQKGHRKGGLSPDAAIAAAKHFIGDIDPAVRRIANRIVAYKQNVQGWEIPDILNRAKQEAEKFGDSKIAPIDEHKLRKAREYEAYISEVSSINERILDDPIAAKLEIETKKIIQENGRVKEYKIVNGVIDFGSVKEYCAHCEQATGHDTHCKTEEQQSTKEPAKILIFPKLSES